MALWNGNKKIDGSRSNTALVKSGHLSPAEKWILDPKFATQTELKGIFKDGVLFNYEYGGPKMEEVVIAKGRAVGVSAPVKDYVSNKFVTVITLPGLTANGNCVGMVPYNITKDWLQLDRFGGNQPSIITTEYVVMPYMPNIQPASSMDVSGIVQEEQALSIDLKMPWGAVIGTLEVGDYVKATPSGRLTKWKKGTDCPSEIVGQALACELDQEPWGWTKWMLHPESEIRGDDNYMNRAYNTAGSSSLPTSEGYMYDPSYFEGNNVYQHIHSQGLHNPTGIPGLHDGSGNYPGYGKNDTEYTDMVLGTVSELVEDNTVMAFQAKDFAGGNLINLKEVVEVKIDDQTVEKENYSIEEKAGIINIKVSKSDAGKTVKATYYAYHYGTHSYLDFKGVVGSFNILLQK